MKGTSYVINLKRRPDRLERFTKFYSVDGPDLPLVVFDAIDGSKESDLSRVPEDIQSRISSDNDFKNSATIRAIAYSHMLVWKMIADGQDDYGMILKMIVFLDRVIIYFLL